MNFALTK